MQYVLGSGTSKSSGEPQWKDRVAEAERSLTSKTAGSEVKGAAVWREQLGLGLRVLSVKICDF